MKVWKKYLFTIKLHQFIVSNSKTLKFPFQWRKRFQKSPSPKKKKMTARTSLNVVYMHINTCRVELVEIIRARYDGCFPGLGLRPTSQGVPCGRTIRPLWYCKYSQMIRSLKFPRAMNTISAMEIFCQIITDCYGKMSRQLL